MSLSVRLTQLDGALPNLALMKLAHWHKANGDRVAVTRNIERGMFEDDYDRVYGSAIFSFSAERVARFLTAWPGAVVGGTGTIGTGTVEGLIGLTEYEHYDYEGWPDFAESIDANAPLNCSILWIRSALPVEFAAMITGILAWPI